MVRNFFERLQLNPYNQTLYVVWGNLLLWIYLTPQFWFWWTPLLWFLLLRVFSLLGEVSLHRYFSHRSYSPSNPAKVFLTVAAFLTGQGSILSWVYIHRLHHKYEDKDKDPHSPLHLPWYLIFLGLYKKVKERGVVNDLLKSPWQPYLLWESQYYHIAWTTVWLLLYALNPWYLYIVVSGVSTWFIGVSSINVFQHLETYGYKKYPEVVSTNSRVSQTFLGAGYHNNHHRNPQSYDIGEERFDFVGFFIRTLLEKQHG